MRANIDSHKWLVKFLFSEICQTSQKVEAVGTSKTLFPVYNTQRVKLGYNIMKGTEYFVS